MRIQSALEQAGVRFLPDERGSGGTGVRLTANAAKPSAVLGRYFWPNEANFPLPPIAERPASATVAVR
jgi:hypothetical protein